ncbi:hypothetical protein AGABI2DRAFT_196248 [Agaricus bisporus var. bisporus H97]|uniref:hypothetical protein n=1 Tax=Agaricus bisporus var. bisporus (strain H97 / ATCC MYA-4626 / FGSC 10389) TaxID=936046 RepID=UPI00029F5601|nr:hypothetical protein AGABI2DRAFT_196248 [Agaricus bisporus var. bisporus H97]EKV41640.1 hypothetical protein AGABI2DRAFT_196248 [Agaricus bisporus var. bisporus H97]
MADPTKHETEQVFKVLKSQKGNHTCFDCSARNPTWSSIPFGVYICLNCSSIHRNMGVHISFVRSTNLDTWQLHQLRRMKIGGNASATEFFNKHGGSSLLNDSDTKKKYTSPAAELYKQELEKRVKEDAVRYPKGIHVDGIDTTGVETPPPKQDDDFFESWSKPSTPKPSSTSSTPARIATPPVLGSRANSSTTTTSTSSSASRTLTTSSAASRSSRTSTTSTTSNTTAKKSKLGGLGAQKTKAVDFAAAERKAREEEERIRQLGYDREREEAEEKTRKEAENKRKATEIGKIATVTTTTSSSSPSSTTTKPAFARLGFGALPGAGAGAAAAAIAAPAVASKVAEDSPTVARDRFGNQKAISSDMYFERNSYDPATVSEAQTRLQTFQGATSISSNQYFGREEEEEMMSRDNAVLGDGSLAGLESAAKDAMSRFLANPDVQNVGESIRTGALKLSDYLAQMNMDR